VRISAAATDAARLIAVVVFPTPPFWLAIAIIFPMATPQRSTWNKTPPTSGQGRSSRNNKTRVPVFGTVSILKGASTLCAAGDVIHTMVVVGLAILRIESTSLRVNPTACRLIQSGFIKDVETCSNRHRCTRTFLSLRVETTCRKNAARFRRTSMR
jgi:hypothetical protein